MDLIEMQCRSVDLLDFNIHFLIVLDGYGDLYDVGVSRTDFINTCEPLEQK